MDPHTTSKKARSCVECHQNPKTLGLGNGQLIFDREAVLKEGVRGKWGFVPAVTDIKTEEGRAQIAPFVNIDGTAMVNTSRKWLRLFNGEELMRILDAGMCVGCHNRYDDPVIVGWKPGQMPQPCSKAVRLTGSFQD